MLRVGQWFRWIQNSSRQEIRMMHSSVGYSTHTHSKHKYGRIRTHTYHFIRRHCDRSIERKVSGRRNGMDVTKNINQIKRDSRSRRKRRGKNGKKITSCLLLYAPNPQRPRSCRHRRRRKSYHCQSHSFSFYFSNINFYMKSSKLWYDYYVCSHTLQMKLHFWREAP